jgi:hypothetical protein
MDGCEVGSPAGACLLTGPGASTLCGQRLRLRVVPAAAGDTSSLPDSPASPSQCATSKLPTCGTLGDMCGRYASSRTRSDPLETFKIEEALAEEEKAPDYNVTPTKTSPTVPLSAPARRGGGRAATATVAEPEVGAGAVVGEGSEDREPDSLH